MPPNFPVRHLNSAPVGGSIGSMSGVVVGRKGASKVSDPADADRTERLNIKAMLGFLTVRFGVFFTLTRSRDF